MPSPVHAGYPPSQLQLHGVVPVPALVVDVEHGLAALAHEVTFRQRRPLVGPLGFVSDEYQPAGEALLTQGLGRFRRGEAGADNDVRLLFLLLSRHS